MVYMRIYTFVCRYIGFFDKGYNIRIYIRATKYFYGNTSF